MRRWRHVLQTLWPFGRHPSTLAADAIKAAEQSQVQAFHDRADAAATRAVAEELEAQIRQHNAANRYDDFLRRTMRGEA